MTFRWAVLLAAAAGLMGAASFKYPEAPRGDVVDDYFGTKVPDPYRWLEDVDSKDTAAWVAAENKLSLPFLAKLPARADIRKRLEELWNYERYGVPERVAGRLFYTRNDGLQNQSVLYVQGEPEQPARVVLDPNKLSRDGTVAMTQWHVSPDGKYLAYGLAEAGSDWNRFRVRDVESGKDTSDDLSRIKFSGISWTKDSAGFFYSRYPHPPKDTAPGVFDELANSKLYYHRLGTAQADDVLVYERPDQPKWGFDSEVSDDGLFLFIKISGSSGNDNALYYKYLGDPQKPKLDGPVAALVERIESQYEPIGNEGSIVYLLTTSGAPRKRIMAVDLRSPAREFWVPIVAQGDDVIEDAWMAGRQFVILSMRDASHRLRRYALNGSPRADLPMPGLGSVAGVSADAQSNELFFSYTDFAQPPQNQRCDLAKGRCEVFQPLTLPFKPGDYVTEQRFYRSKDGTRVPMFITHLKSVSLDTPRPTLLHGYGGFDYALVPSFARPELAMPALAWMERGGVYVVANLRGGGEYGAVWHEAGIKQRKQNVFDDFITAAEFLIAKKLTTSAQLAIHGRSNGGLLVGAVVNQRPELFAAGVADVGVMDMLRFHKFTIGWAWTSDYGSSDDAAGFKYLFPYSPYHNIRAGTKYPAMLITTADHDDRVVPGHSFKYAAAMQAAQGGDNPILLRVDVKSGHGPGKPTALLMEEVADRVAFITYFTSPPEK